MLRFVTLKLHMHDQVATSLNYNQQGNCWSSSSSSNAALLLQEALLAVLLSCPWLVTAAVATTLKGAVATSEATTVTGTDLIVAL